MEKQDEAIKHLFANALRELIHEKPFEKITVLDITNRCGVSRRAFYYHFKDKQALLEWIYQDNAGSEPAEMTIAGYLDFCRRNARLSNDTLLFRIARFDTTQNGFFETHWKTTYSYFFRVIESEIGARPLAPEVIGLLASFYTWGNSLMGVNIRGDPQNVSLEEMMRTYEALVRNGLPAVLDALCKDPSLQKHHGERSPYL